MSRATELLWNLNAWADVANLARAIMVGVSVLAAAHYLAGLGVSLGMARQILLGV
jgi:hypothetical protein